jgi:hypothetical protein
MSLNLNGRFPMEKYEGLKLTEALGKDIACEDGVTRNVFSICPAFGKFGWACVNATEGEDGRDPDAGYLVFLPDLFGQLRGEPVPEDERERFRKIAESFSMEWEPKERKKLFSWEKKKKQKKMTRLLR